MYAMFGIQSGYWLVSRRASLTALAPAEPAACAAKTASSPSLLVVRVVVHPPHPKPMIMAMMAPPIRPHTPYFTLAAVTGVIAHPSRDAKMAGHVNRSA